MKKIIASVRNRLQDWVISKLQNPDQLRVRVLEGKTIVTIGNRSDYVGFLKIHGGQAWLTDKLK